MPSDIIHWKIFVWQNSWHQNQKSKSDESDEKSNFDADANSEKDNMERNEKRIDYDAESRRIKRRVKARILKYVRYKEENDEYNYCRENILLFSPWREESEEVDTDHVVETYNIVTKLKETVENSI